MNLEEIRKKLKLEDITPEIANAEEATPTGGYVSDLLSEALANAPRGGILVTMQIHMNVVAVASHCELLAVIFAADRVPEEKVRKRAVEEGIKLYVSREQGFDIVGRLYKLGLRGGGE